ncbi:hypothetical protein [Chroococcidiopsis sp. CCNUC1]|uniref:hypothetical protein n=1 Tax=Chroococcidiopsis sp. CCNUC1 TaxID=2653189 RepID=UPI002020F0B6|nr:hypothetical protein [Chroococcidiopsis sp. CCNUC1]URD50968.1 hypothetical protein M5J74_03040 [Chroococcidiopsis sp. CCNUC1]
MIKFSDKWEIREQRVIHKSLFRKSLFRKSLFRSRKPSLSAPLTTYTPHPSSERTTHHPITNYQLPTTNYPLPITHTLTTDN